MRDVNIKIYFGIQLSSPSFKIVQTFSEYILTLIHPCPYKYEYSLIVFIAPEPGCGTSTFANIFCQISLIDDHINSKRFTEKFTC